MVCKKKRAIRKKTSLAKKHGKNKPTNKGQILPKPDFIINFLNATDIKTAKIYKSLKCSAEEALILREITAMYLDQNPEVIVFDVLNALYKNDNYEFLSKLPLIKNLIDQGWISIQSFTNIKPNQTSLLEILYLPIKLSSVFLSLLERGNLDLKMPVISPYGDDLKYLQDEFVRVDMHVNLALAKANHGEKSQNYLRILDRIKALETQISKRLALSKDQPKIYTFMKEQNLNEKEALIFLALLKEEYSSTDESLRDMNTLLDLISTDEYDKIKNRSLLEENSHLIKNQIIDYDEVLTNLGGINRSFFITEEVLSELMHPSKKDQKPKKIKLGILLKEHSIFELLEPKTSLEDVVLNPKTKEMIDAVMKQMDKTVSSRLKEWGIKDKKSGVEAKILFHGTPGTGKTITAVSMAKSLKKQILSFDCSKILSMYMGESEKNVRKIFDAYKEISHKSRTSPVLLLNEADQFLSARSTNSSSADKMHNQMQNIFLEQIEKFDGVLIATTNLLETFDQAFSRRFNYKIKFEKPSKQERLILWQKLLPKNIKTKALDLESLAKFELSGGQIGLVIKNTAFKVATTKNAIFTQEDFLESIQKEISSNFGEDSVVGFFN